MPHIQSLENEKIFIKEMFPHVSSEEVENLFITSKDINVIITKILDGSYKGLQINLKDLIITKAPKKSHAQDLYYPELFSNIGVDACSGDVDRNQACVLYSKIRNLKNKINICKNKKVLEYQSEEISNLYSELERLNRKRALIILNKSLQKPSMIDLHGLYTKRP